MNNAFVNIAKGSADAHSPVSLLMQSFSTWPDSIKQKMSRGRLLELQQSLEVVYGDKSRAKRISSRVIEEAAGKPNPIKFIEDELEFEVQLAATGGKLIITLNLVEDVYKNPELWQVRQNRRRD